MIKVILQQSSTSANVSIPLDVCARLGFEAGQELTLVEGDNGLKIIKVEPELARPVAKGAPQENQSWVDCGK
jgi:hypothetical protein